MYNHHDNSDGIGTGLLILPCVSFNEKGQAQIPMIPSQKILSRRYPVAHAPSSLLEFTELV